MITRIRKSILLAIHILGNLLAHTRGYELTYIVEADLWSIHEDGKAITKALNTQMLICARISTTTIGLRDQIIHFGSINTYIKRKVITKPHPSNTLILTWFHVIPDDERLVLIKEAQKNLTRIHTSCESTKKTLIQAGVDENKIIVIPLGVDTSLFTPTTREQKLAIRKQLRIDPNRFVIGSFQKDGVGWGEGLEPKLIKGPDLFVETLRQLKHLNPLVLLTGPARGYVKYKLEQHGIEYKHYYLKTIAELPEIYQALDLYLITSRLEGGPKALLEAWASGIPVVSTPVGMVPDIGMHQTNVLISTTFNVQNIAHLVMDIYNDKMKKENLINNGNKTIKRYDWINIAKQYHAILYTKF